LSLKEDYCGAAKTSSEQLLYKCCSVQQREGTKLGLLCYVLHKDHGRNLGGKAKGKVCTAIMYENIQNYETEINILQCILYDKCEVEI
jgi:hypothetical protein